MPFLEGCRSHRPRQCPHVGDEMVHGAHEFLSRSSLRGLETIEFELHLQRRKLLRDVIVQFVSEARALGVGS